MNRQFTTLLYTALALAYLLVFGREPGWSAVLVKPLPILLLALLVWREAEPGWRTPLLVALLFSALGDVLLALNWLLGGFFVAGLGSFLVAQLAYARCFWGHAAPTTLRRWLAASWIPVALLLAWVILPVADGQAWSVGLYLLAITAMVTGAAVTDRPLWLAAGALCFAFSDGTIAIDRFVAPVRADTAVIMASYYLAQWLICVAALQAPRRLPA
ncbi:MAG: lysoplasmalogenase [Gammaproteobacteria bacterium]